MNNGYLFLLLQIILGGYFLYMVWFNFSLIVGTLGLMQISLLLHELVIVHRTEKLFKGGV